MDPSLDSPTSRSSSGSSSPKPQDSWTGGSHFQDSAVDMDGLSDSVQTASAVDTDTDYPAHSISPISQSLADKMRRLAAAAWTLEQDDEMSMVKKERIEQTLHSLEEILEEHKGSEIDTIHAPSEANHTSHTHEIPKQILSEEDELDQLVDESDLFLVHDNLGVVVASMRLRQQEQRHLHILTATKLEAVAQRCLFQEQQMQDLLEEMKSLRVENRSLGEENDRLTETVAELQSEASKKEVAVSAMASAVAGLEGWMDDATRARMGQLPIATPVRGQRQRRAVVRGKGRFHGRYYIDEETDRHIQSVPDAEDIQDGVRAWIRGFRDVEDAYSSPAPGRPKEPYRRPNGLEEDDWGEFESPLNMGR